MYKESLSLGMHGVKFTWSYSIPGIVYCQFWKSNVIWCWTALDPFTTSEHNLMLQNQGLSGIMGV